MKKLLLVFSIIVFVFNVAATNGVEAKRLIENSQNKLLLNNIHLNLDLETFGAKGESKTKKMIVFFAEFASEKKVLIEIISPENVSGTKILTTNYPNKKGLIEIYMPATGKVQKIRANQHRLKIMGSEIPIMQFSAFIDTDFDFVLLGKDLFNGVQCHKIRVEKPGEKSYGIAYVSVKEEHLLGVEKYDLKNKLLSRTELSDYVKVENTNNKVYPTDIKVNNFKTGKSSHMKVRNFRYLSNIDINDFTLAETAS
ncbi:MAG: outer membrane lipoprotein-sorting protein [Bacteroidetes bacterium]|nr:outer membrane lipoprotein-sorting protein [Bacteroidota bacterium]